MKRIRLSLVHSLALAALWAHPGLLEGAPAGKWVSHVDPSFISDIQLRNDQLYIASSGGLVVFETSDSSSSQYTNVIGLPSNFLTALTFDKSGSLYVGTEDSGIARLDPVADGFDVTPLNSIFHGLSDDRITSLAAWGDTIAYGTKNGAGLIIRGFPGPRFFRADGLPSNSVNALIADGDRVWIATDSGVVSLDRFGFIKNHSSGLPALNARTFARSDTSLWVGTTSGVARYDRSTETWKGIGLSGEPVFSLSFDGVKLWAGARGRFYENAGAGWVSRGLFALYAKYDLNSTISEVRGLQPMPDGSVYLGVGDPADQRRGCNLIVFDGSGVRDISFNAPPMNFIFRLALDIDGSLWVSSIGFGVGKLSPQGVWFNYNRATGDTNLSTRFVNFALIADSDGTKWIGSLSSPSRPMPIDELRDSQDLDYSNDVWFHHGIDSGGGDGLGSLGNRNAAQDPFGNRWFLSNNVDQNQGWWGINVLSEDKSAWKRVNRSTTGGKMEGGHITDVAFGPSGVVYIAIEGFGVQKWTTGGYDVPNLFDLSDDSWETIAQRGVELESSANILSLALRSDGALWIGTTIGIYKYFNGTFRRIRANRGFEVGLLGNEVKDLLLDRKENLWIATEMGLNRIARNDDNAISSFTTPAVWQNQLNLFFPAEVVSPLVNASCESLALHPSRDVLYIGTLGGISAFDISTPRASGQDLSRVYLYPNPILGKRGDRSLKISNITSSVFVEVYSLEGQLVHSQSASASDEIIWDLRTQEGFFASSGVYVVRITGAGGTLVKRVSLIR